METSLAVHPTELVLVTLNVNAVTVGLGTHVRNSVNVMVYPIAIKILVHV